MNSISLAGRAFIALFPLIFTQNLRAQNRRDTTNDKPRDTTALHEIVVKGHRQSSALTTATTNTLSGATLLQTRGATLGETLKSIPGLNSIQTGPSISKPVIHGLHSNRVLILNNGVRQEGQQWGSEHAPEIDPFTAQQITIIKGAASIRYGADALAGVVLLEPPALPTDKPLGGELNLVAASNGRMGATSGMLEGAPGGALEGLKWRAQGTLKRAGNFKTANYYLDNTALFEGDFSGTAAYERKRYGITVYYSQFNNKLGIFSGSHVGNETDLYTAFARAKPITPDVFSYGINRSYQQVYHDLLKLSAWYRFKNTSSLEFIFGRQKDLRKEYDVDLPYNPDPALAQLPQLSFQIKTHTADLIYHQPGNKKIDGMIGFSGSTQGNVFRGIRYLVPNFRNYSGGLFAIEKYHLNKLTLEAGLRYDYRWLRVYRRDDISLQVYDNTHTYNNITGTAGASWQISEALSLNANIGTAWRAPSVNELYIKGIHLSAASYELGDSSFHSERSVNSTLSLQYHTQKLHAQLDLYDNEINGFIYAKPALRTIQLVQGTFPLFIYTQENVRIRGLDAEISYALPAHLTWTGKASLVRAFNKTIHDYLVFMPADRYDNTLKYTQPRLKNAYISLQYLLVARQNRVPPNSDYVPPPPGYHLFNTGIGCALPLGKRLLDLNFSIDNLANKAYRDYLNRFRYYADDLGRNFILRTKMSF
ncbi:TonB-dependent receptor [Chitinophaga agrisoli]|uniref:TonB-dependent receptor n=1 Tax=Chitinophaga agrisoli TaxID=2607653 RepID=A0A5B2VVD4_9BACT|nr:TonB-dependent receptor [Chitinophaga agrisoli]KAA2243025.1 TonB-dependent receptor [Chitinophaga agrisoli]